MAQKFIFADYPNLWLRGTRFYIRRAINGREGWESLNTDNRRLAIELRNEKMGVPKEDVPRDRTTRNTVAYEKYIADRTDPNAGKRLVKNTSDKYASLWRLHVSDEFKGLVVAKVTDEDIIKEIRSMRAKKNAGKQSAWQLRNFYVMLSAYFTWCSRGKNRYRNDNPVRQIPKDEIPPIPKPDAVAKEIVHNLDEVARMAEFIPTTTMTGFVHKTIILLLPLLGLRISEMLALWSCDYEPDMFDPADEESSWGQFVVQRQISSERDADDSDTWFTELKGRHTTEGDQNRVLPILDGEMKELIDNFIARGVADGWLQADWSGRRLTPKQLLFPNTLGKPQFSNHIWATLQKAAKAAGCENHMTLHHFRHVYLTERRADDLTWREVARLAGHKDDGELAKARYAHITDQKSFNRSVAAKRAARAAGGK